MLFKGEGKFMKKDANYFIEKLALERHPEGGYYKNTFVSGETIDAFDTTRKLYTNIYFLLKSGEVSHFHRLKSDEVWYYHGGSPLTIHVIHENGDYEEIKLGLNLEAGERPQAIVRKNSIFGSSVIEQNTFSLVGCMVSPGFDFADFELFTQEALLKLYPQHEEMIRKLAYEKL